jgi:hypothetical protein
MYIRMLQVLVHNCTADRWIFPANSDYGSLFTAVFILAEATIEAIITQRSSLFAIEVY